MPTCSLAGSFAASFRHSLTFFVWVTSLFAEVWGFDLGRWPNVAAWAAHLRGLAGFARPSTSCPCMTHYFDSHVGQGLSKYELEVQRIDARREQTWLSQLRVRKKSLYSRDSSDMSRTPDEARQHIVHVLNEWAELAPGPRLHDHVSRTSSGAFGTTTGASKRAHKRHQELNGMGPCPTGPARRWPHAASTPRHQRAYARAAGRRWISIEEVLPLWS